MKRNLEQRFKDFLNTLSGVEEIDNLKLTDKQDKESKADYFAENRQLIIELKSLETDTEHKVQKILEPHRLRSEFPVFFGKWEVEKVLKHLPDGTEINAQLMNAVTSSLQTIYRKANKQIKKSKTNFDIPNSKGMLIVLNEYINILTPESIIYRIRKTAQKKNPDGSLQFSNIDSVLMLNEAHFSKNVKPQKAFPIIHIPINQSVELIYNDFIDILMRKWAEFNNADFYDFGNVNSMSELNIESVARDNEQKRTKITRQESWERYYEWNPYFHSYDEEMMKWMFKIIMTNLALGLTKKATQEQKDRVKFWIEVFTHFMKEVDNRAIDIRLFTKDENTWKDIDREMKKRFPDLETEK